ncbi:MAG: four helix bundle protein [Arcticibacter sp.]
MPLIKRFEDMLSWKKARELNKIIYQETLNPSFSKDYALKDQIRKSSISIMSNIAEGFERGTENEFKYFLRVAKGSAGELRSQLYIASDLNYLDHKCFSECSTQITEITKLISAFIHSIDSKRTTKTLTN